MGHGVGMGSRRGKGSAMGSSGKGKKSGKNGKTLGNGGDMGGPEGLGEPRPPIMLVNSNTPALSSAHVSGSSKSKFHVVIMNLEALLKPRNPTPVLTDCTIG